MCLAFDPWRLFRNAMILLPTAFVRAAGQPATMPTVPPAHPPHGPSEPGGMPEPGTLPPQIHDPDPADIPEIIDPESPQHPRLRGRTLRRRPCAPVAA
jgi:hypothetical protein